VNKEDRELVEWCADRLAAAINNAKPDHHVAEDTRAGLESVAEAIQIGTDELASAIRELAAAVKGAQ
jgi:putative protein kinase ArgK-like GTPase of G3E family